MPPLRTTVPLACILGACGLAILQFTGDSQAQSSSAAPAARWPARLDAVAAAPDSHRVLLENDRVRVLEVVIKPGEREPVHTHAWPSLMFVSHPAKLLYTPVVVVGDGVQLGPVETVAAAPKPIGTPPPRWLPPEGPHAIVNIDTTEFRALRVEIKDGG